MMHRKQLVTFGFLFLLALVDSPVVHAQKTKTAYRRASARCGAPASGVYEVPFTSSEEDLMKAKQRDTVEMIAGFLPGKSANQVARRCVEMGLACGDAVAQPQRNSEQWRNLPRRD